MRVSISEVFTSIEGEGIYLGTKTLFIRLAGCPLRCFYCDTPYALSIGNGTYYSIDEAKTIIARKVERGTFKANFTGGEPLLQHEAVRELARYVRDELLLKTYLESSCYDASRFLHVLPYIDICKIEFKLKDSNAIDDKHYTRLLENEMLCLRHAIASRKVTYIKVVLSSLSKREEVEELARMIFEGDTSKAIDGFVLQPVNGVNEPTLEHMLAMYDAVHQYYPNVRIIPQMHKVMGIP
ncbi:7-carboxy-7-deazaguanine synthase [archaeon HR05]|nr:7-carboxy-7-deazaguanine synthase [archaeon HR05]